jgi:translation initiation factor 1
MEVHLRIKQRNGKKCITIIEGLNKALPDKTDLEKLAKKFRKQFSCSVTIKEEGSTIELQGDHRAGIQDDLVKQAICKLEDIKVHGF